MRHTDSGRDARTALRRTLLQFPRLWSMFCLVPVRLLVSGRLLLRDHSFFNEYGGGGASESFRAKRGASQKLRGKWCHAGLCTGLRGAFKIKWGGGVRANFFRDN